MPLEIKGADLLIRNLVNLARHASADVAGAAYEEMEIEMAEAKQRTPVDTGVLRASGFVNPPARRGRAFEIVLGFGGPAKDYAIPQHERLDYFHEVGQAKYLESVLDENRDQYPQRIARRVNLNKLVSG